jgi:hypothetical protein
MPSFYADKGPPSVAVAAAGSTQADAAALTLGTLNVVSAADGTKGVKLPAAAPGDVVRVYSSAATNALKVYAQTGGAINAGAANAAFSQTAQKVAVFECTNGTDWVALLGS